MILIHAWVSCDVLSISSHKQPLSPFSFCRVHTHDLFTHHRRQMCWEWASERLLWLVYVWFFFIIVVVVVVCKGGARAKTTAIYIYKIGIYQLFYINSDVVIFIHSAKSEQNHFGRCVIKRPRLTNHIYAFPAAIILCKNIPIFFSSLCWAKKTFFEALNAQLPRAHIFRMYVCRVLFTLLTKSSSFAAEGCVFAFVCIIFLDKWVNNSYKLAFSFS